MRLHLGAMDHAPPPVEGQIVQHPFDRARAPGGLNLVNFGDLLGQMQMDRAALGNPRRVAQLLGRDAAQRMRRDAQVGVGRQGLQRRSHCLDQPRKPVRFIAKPALSGPERASVAAAELILHRQQRQTDAGGLGCCRYAVGHFA